MPDRPKHVVCPRCGETDNLEYLGKSTDSFLTTSSTVFAYKCKCGVSFTVMVAKENAKPALFSDDGDSDQRS